MSELAAFALGERLHSGASSVVYRARRIDDGAAVVIKLLQSEHPSQAYAAHLEHEYRLMSKLDIPGVVRVLGLLRDRRQVGIVMEDVGADSLAAVISKRRLELGEVLRIGSQAARILGDLHRNRVVHGDVNPANMLFDPASHNVWFIDLGIAFELSREQVAIEASGMIRGPLRYIAPGQTGP